MKKQTIRTAVLTCLAMTLIMCASVTPSLSYFTTYVTAQGGYTIHMNNVDTDVEERVDGGAKHITMVNTGEVECFVRVRLYAGSMVGLSYSGTGWSDGGDGYWYYSEILAPGARTEELHALITPVPGMDQDYNVIVIGECTPVLYDENGEPYADWSLRIEEG